MFYYKALIQYDGTGYCGFQCQKDISTIQDELNKILHDIVQTKVSTVGASRTDTGVHAAHQVVKVTLDKFFDPSFLLNELESRLPKQIRCLEFTPCPGSFKPSASHLSKEYRYFFVNTKSLPASELRFLSNFSRPLDFESMNKCLKMIIGAHDFSAFCSKGSNVTNTLREVYEADILEVNPHELFEGSDLFQFSPQISRCYQFRIVGKGFLKQMVRHLMASLWLVGSGKMTCEEFSLLLSSCHGTSIQKKWKPAPAQGLFLFSIQYPKNV